MRLFSRSWGTETYIPFKSQGFKDRAEHTSMPTDLIYVYIKGRKRLTEAYNHKEYKTIVDLNQLCATQ